MNTYKKMDKMMYILGLLFLIIPSFIFLIFWVKWYLSIPSICIICYLGYKLITKIKYKTEKEYKNIYDIKKWCVVIFGLLILNILSGTGGFAYQNWDHNARNAVMHDLIDYDYPVKYDYSNNAIIERIGEKGYLSYYFSYWLISALVGKTFGFYAANICLFVYQFIGLILFYYFLSRYFSKIKIWYLLIFISFSGLDVIEYYVNHGTSFALGTHIDASLGNRFISSSFITQLFWVFNQSIPIWIIVMMYFNEKNNDNIGLLMFLALLFSPFPAVGFALLIIMNLLFGKYKEKDKSTILRRIKDCFTKTNLLSLLPIAIILLFYLGNATNKQKGITWFGDYGLEMSTLIKTYLSFLFGNIIIISCILNNKKNRKYIIFISTCFIIISQFYLGDGADLLNRASIPLLLFQLLLIIDSFTDKDVNKYHKVLLLCYLVIASISPFQEIYRSITYTDFKNYNYLNNYTDSWRTYGNESNVYGYLLLHNFSSKYDSNKIIFKYIFK